MLHQSPGYILFIICVNPRNLREKLTVLRFTAQSKCIKANSLVRVQIFLILHCVTLTRMGLIQIEGMEFYSFHGHYREEQIVGNKFLVDLIIETDMEEPSKSDNLKDAVNYQQAYNIIKKEMEMKSHLLENIAGRILDALYAEMQGIKKATVKVSKMNPPMGGKIHSVSVTLSR